MDITQAIEILKNTIKHTGFAMPVEKESILFAISALESLQQARDELGEKLEFGKEFNKDSDCDFNYVNSYNTCYDLVEKIIAKKNLEIEELKNTSETAKELLREFKERCSVERIANIQLSYPPTFIKASLDGSVNELTLSYEAAQAISKYILEEK